MVGEIVGVLEGNAVEGDVELAVLKAADTDILAFRKARTVRRGVENAWRELDRFVVIARQRKILFDEIAG